MTVRLLEVDFQRRGVPYQKKSDGSLVVPVEGKITTHPVVLTAEQHGWIQGKVVYPSPRIANIEKFCNTVEKYFLPSGVVIQHDRRKQDLVIASFMSEELARETILLLAGVCDKFLPLYLRLLEKGDWDRRLLALAFMEEGHFPSTRYH